MSMRRGICPSGAKTVAVAMESVYHATGDAYLLMYDTGRNLLRCKRAQPGWLQARAVGMNVRAPYPGLRAPYRTPFAQIPGS